MKYIYSLTLIFFVMITPIFAQQQNKTFILVHAQWHGAWCWNKLVPLLHERGFNALSFDLPGHGTDSASIENVTLEDCVRKVVEVANAQSGTVVLVGHSSSGVVIAQASEILGKNKVSALVFVDAFLPNDGESVFSLAGKFAVEGTPLGKSLIVSSDQKTVSLNLEKIEELLYHDCPATDLIYAKSHLRQGPLAVLATPVRLTASNYGNIPKFYILCTQAKDMDKTKLSKNVKCQKVYTLQSSHSPFFSMPDKMAAILEEIY